MADVTEITLGDRKYGIGRLTIGQLIEVGALQMTGNNAATTAETADDRFMRALGARMIGTIAAALTKVAPEMTAASIGDMPMTMDELRVAYTAVLEHAGLIVAAPSTGEGAGSL
jgi:hypothetical protein